MLNEVSKLLDTTERGVGREVWKCRVDCEGFRR
jgi:hypothetical protein